MAATTRRPERVNVRFRVANAYLHHTSSTRIWYRSARTLLHKVANNVLVSIRVSVSY